MTEYLTDSEDEIKRAEHLLFVSLKYARTVDVIRNVIKRLITAHEFLINGYLDLLQGKNVIEEPASAPLAKINQIKKHNKEEEIKSFVEHYLFLRKLYRAKYTASKEFRRHVTMTSTIIDLETDTETIVEVEIDNLREYFDQTRQFWQEYKNIVKPEENELYE